MYKRFLIWGKKYYIYIILFIASFSISLIGINNGHDWGGDFSQYIAQARAIDTNTINEWLSKNKWIIDNSSPGLGSIAYPWLFSILIAPIYHFFGLNYIPYQIFLSCIFSLCIVSFFWLLKKRGINSWVALLFPLLLILNKEYLVLTKLILSDLPCLLFTILAWIAIDSYLTERTIKKAIIIGVLGFLSFFTRTMGAAVLVSLAIVDGFYLIKQIRIKEVKHIGIVCLPYICFAAIWLVSSIVFPKGGASYTTYFSINLRQIVDNIRYYLKILWDFVYQTQLGDHYEIQVLTRVACLCAIALIIIGFFKQLYNGDHLAIYSIVMMSMLMVYDYRQGTRFLLSIYPVLLMFVYYGYKTVIRSRKGKITAMILGSVICITSIYCGIHYINSIITTPAINEVGSDNAKGLYQYINTELNNEDVVYFRKPRVLYLYTDVYSYRVDGILSMQDISKADYVLRAKALADNSLDSLIDSSQQSFELVFQNEDFKLYKVLFSEGT